MTRRVESTYQLDLEWKHDTIGDSPDFISTNSDNCGVHLANYRRAPSGGGHGVLVNVAQRSRANLIVWPLLHRNNANKSQCSQDITRKTVRSPAMSGDALVTIVRSTAPA